MFMNKNIAQRLKAAFFSISLLVALSGTIGVIVIKFVDHDASIIFDEKHPVTQLAQSLETAMHAEISAQYLTVIGDETGPAQMQKWNKYFEDQLAQLIAIDKTDADQRSLSKVDALHTGVRAVSDKIIAMREQGEAPAEIFKLLQNEQKFSDQLTMEVQQIVAHAESDMKTAMNQAKSFQKNSTTALITITVLAFFGAYGLGQRVSKGITVPLDRLVGYAKTISEGKLNEEFSIAKTNDEIGLLVQAFQKMVEGLRVQIREILEGSAVIASSVSELSASSAQLASSAAETASSVNETTATIEEVRQTTELSSVKSEQMAAESMRIRETSRLGKEATEKTIGSMDKIQTQMGAIAETIICLSEQSQAIGQIIATVDSLSEQSNVLAVNASIEAAKAGEQGRGFSVVAQEVKSLAEQSKQATKQVRAILNEIQKATSTAVMATEQGGKVVEKGMDAASLSGQSIVTLTDGLEQASDIATQISAASQQQRIGMSQITVAMESINEASLQNATSAHQLEDAVGSLKLLGEKLQDIVKIYQV
jgi:methyl-accepting chemotaxis protein